MTRLLVLLAVLGCVAPSGAAAQDLPLDPVRAVLGASTRVSWVADQSAWFVGGKVGLIFQERLAINAAGYAQTSSLYVGGTGPGTSFRMNMGYGGLLAEYLLRTDQDLDVTVASLIGMGHGELVAPVQQLQITADNFFVLEPEVFVRYRVFPWARIFASGGYRFTWGVALPGVTAGDLNGASLGLGIQIGR